VADGVDSSRFYKLCVDAKLYNKQFRTNDVDILYTKHKIKGQRKMDWRGFKAALAEVATKRGEGLEAVVNRIIQATANGPSVSGTFAEPNRFHDDKNTFTGVYREGGPTMIDREKMTMSDLCDRFKKATVRGTPLHVAHGPGIHQILNSSSADAYDGASTGYDDMMTMLPHTQSHTPSALPPTPGQGGNLEILALKENTVPAGQRNQSDDSLRDDAAKDGIRAVFNEYSKLSRGIASTSKQAGGPLTPGGNQTEEGVDSSRFLKLCNEASLFGKLFRTNDVDIVFTRNKREGGRKLDFQGFVMSLLEVAVKKNVSLTEVVDQVIFAASIGSRFSAGTVAEANKFYDDRRTWTGSAAASASEALGSSTPQVSIPPPPPVIGVSSSSSSSSSAAAADLTNDDLSVPVNQSADLFLAFETFARMSRALKDRNAAGNLGPEDGIDSSRFLKLCNDSQLFDGFFRLVDVDVIFTKSKASKEARKLGFDGFVLALVEICRKKGKPMREVVDAIVFATTGR